jgi:hypothetical protein
MNIKQPQRDARPGRVPAIELMIDYGLLMIWGDAMAVAAGGRSQPPMRQTKPIWPLGIGDCRLGIRSLGSRVRCVDGAPNKPNLCRFWASNGDAARKQSQSRRPRPPASGATRCEIRFTRYASAVWTKCQTKPIYPHWGTLRATGRVSTLGPERAGRGAHGLRLRHVPWAG